MGAARNRRKQTRKNDRRRQEQEQFQAAQAEKDARMNGPQVKKKFTAQDFVKDLGPVRPAQTDAYHSWCQERHLVLQGYPGTGKSFIAIHMGLMEVFDKDFPADKLILIRSAVASRDLGALPGTEEEKTAPFERPYRKICKQLFNRATAYDNLKANGTIEFETTSFLRGDTFDNSVIVIDECFTPDTEVLTEHGFKRFDEIDGTEKIAQVTYDDEIEFVEPSRHIKKQYTGNLSTVSTHRHSITATENHDFVYIDRHGEILKAKAKEKPSKTYKIKTSVTPIIDDFVDDEDLHEIVYSCALQADGHYQKTLRDSGKETYNWMIQFSRKDKIERFESAIKSLGIKYSKYEPDDKNRVRFYLGQRHPKYIDMSNPKTKTFDISSIIGKSKAFILTFVKEVWKWDGSTKGYTPLYCSTNYDNIKTLQTLGHMVGFRCRIMKSTDTRSIFKTRPKTNYRLTFVDTTEVSLQKAEHTNRHYDGEVYCVTVPSGMIVVRQNENITVTGNCQNMTWEEAYTVLSRVGENSRVIFICDGGQNDLYRKKNDESGLNQILDVLEDMNEFDFINFQASDIVRSGFVKSLVISAHDKGYI